jgi:predicted nucleic acid-binding protein
LIIHLDTSVLIDALCGPRRSRAKLRAQIAHGHDVAISTIALYEWLRGPREYQELRTQNALMPADTAAPLDAAARIFREVKGTRRRGFDIAIAACAIEHGAAFWTLNPQDFEDIPGLKLFRP